MLQNKRVLIADDAEESTEMYGHLLRDAPFSVDFARCGKETLGLYEAAKSEGRPYSLLVLDLAMPDITGTQITEGLRATGDEVPIAFLTANDSTVTTARAAMSNVIAVWIKPMDVLNLQSLIEGALAALPDL